MATPDLLLEQINNYARAKGLNWQGACTTAIRHLNEVLISPRMRRYVYGISQDPVRCAVAARLESTGKSGRYPRGDEESGGSFLQNNHLRVYLRNDGTVAMEHDPEGVADYSRFLSDTVQRVSEDMVGTRVMEGMEYWGSEVEVIEEAGVVATVRQRVEFRVRGEGKGPGSREREAVSEFRWMTVEADGRWVALTVERLYQNGEHSSETVVRFSDYEVSEGGEVGVGKEVRLCCRGRPTVSVYVAEWGEVEGVAWRSGGELVIVSPSGRSVRVKVLVFVHEQAPDAQECQWLMGRPEVSMAAGEAVVENPTSWECVRAVRLREPEEGLYWVKEGGWWHVRGVQLSREQLGTEFCKVVMAAGEQVRIRGYGLMDGVCKAGWGCQYLEVIRDVRGREGGGAVRVKVVDISPKVFAPRVEFAHEIKNVKVDGKQWRYFDERYVFLPQARGEYEVEAEYGKPDAPHVAVTFGKVGKARMEAGKLEVEMMWNEWSDRKVPEGFWYHMGVKLEGWELEGVQGCEVVRRLPRFESVDRYELAGEGSVVHMVPRSFNDPPFKRLDPNGAVVVRLRPSVICISMSPPRMRHG